MHLPGAQKELLNGKFGILFETTAESISNQIFSNHLPSSSSSWKNSIMFKKFSLTDKLLFVAAFLSLAFSEILYFQGHKPDAIFVGIWVPSILGFGIYLKLIGSAK